MIPQNVGKIISPENLPAEIKETAPMHLLSDVGRAVPSLTADRIDYMAVVNRLSSEVRRIILKKALERSEGNKNVAARLLGISRYTLHRELKKINMN